MTGRKEGNTHTQKHAKLEFTTLARRAGKGLGNPSVLRLLRLFIIFITFIVVALSREVFVARNRLTTKEVRVDALLE